MGDRRRYERFVLESGAEGTFRSLEDVTVDRLDGDELWISTPVPATPGETVTVAVEGHKGEDKSVFSGEVTRCQRTTANGTARYRVIIKVKARRAGAEGQDQQDQVGAQKMETNGG